MAKTVVIRKTLSAHKELLNCIEQFELPETLKPYEVEIDIRAIAANFAVRRYIDRVYTHHLVYSACVHTSAYSCNNEYLCK